ncbi:MULTISPECIES: helix-turn-helix domain-containing protein [unclassified Mycobacterium]|uniref:TetR/AcrR family transcriptional regulator n=1 Tax=unclassified Mycobacterium TaxID=2642494 RepID=UPI0029C6C8DF|nr:MULTISPECIES: helix-turn-helix domain-containing protein [unclassified Mycobacterium]
MTGALVRPLRSDAARNADRILRAARDVYASAGPDAAVDAIARQAGVGERTLYRRFPSKGELVRAALDQSIAENLSPAIERALRRANPLQGLTDLIEAAISLGAQEHHLLAAARRAGALAGISAPLDDALQTLMSRAQAMRLVRADLVRDDLPRIIAMLNSVLWTMDPSGGGWRRYVALVLDGMTTTEGRRLRPVPALRYSSPEADWPL